MYKALNTFVDDFFAFIIKSALAAHFASTLTSRCVARTRACG
jgi:hypothetical protein